MATNTRPGASSSTGGVLKRLLVGRALATHKQEHQLLPKILALPVFASDALSSTAYATEEMMLVLVVAGAAALAYAIPIGVAISCLLAIVITSYRQTVRAYPRGGGSYIVARENLGLVPGLIAAAAILTDYVLTVAVSMTAGTIAITSALPSLATHKVALAISLTVLITLVHLRVRPDGGRDAGVRLRRVPVGMPARRNLDPDDRGRVGARRLPHPPRVLIRSDRPHRRRGCRRRRPGVPTTAGSQRGFDPVGDGHAPDQHVPGDHGSRDPPPRAGHARHRGVQVGARPNGGTGVGRGQ